MDRNEKNKIKVLNIIWSMGAGGAQQVVLNYLRDFYDDSDINFELCVYDRVTDSKYDREIKDNNYNVRYLNNPHTKVNIPYIKRWFQKRVAEREWKKVISEVKPDIIHVHISELLCHTLNPIVHCGVPVRFDTLHSNPYRNKGKKRSIIKRAFNCERFIPICVTEEQVKQAIDWYGINKYEIIHNGIDIQAIHAQIVQKQVARKSFKLNEDEFVILGVGRLNKIKRFDYLIRIFAELQKKIPNSKLILAGDGKEAAALKRLTESMKLENTIRFLGNLESVIELYCAADVLAVTSKTEASSLVAIEAQVTGLRCVLSDGVPKESIILQSTQQMRANATIDEWMEALLDSNHQEMTVHQENDYEVHHMSKKMKEVYLKYYKKYEGGMKK